MISKLPILSVALAFACVAPLRAAENKTDFQPATTISAILTQQTGQVVDLRLKSGEKIGGKVEKTGTTLVHLTQLTGSEYFEAFLVIDEISAVVVRSPRPSEGPATKPTK